MQRRLDISQVVELVHVEVQSRGVAEGGHADPELTAVNVKAINGLIGKVQHAVEVLLAYGTARVQDEDDVTGCSAFWVKWGKL